MSNEDNESKKTKRPYEPPRIFDLSGSVAHAVARCRPGNQVEEGGSPSGGGEKCQPGGIASGGKCQPGNLAGGGNCNPGSSASAKCQPGGNPSDGKKSDKGSDKDTKKDRDKDTDKKKKKKKGTDVEAGGVAEGESEDDLGPSVEGTTPKDQDTGLSLIHI